MAQGEMRLKFFCQCLPVGQCQVGEFTEINGTHDFMRYDSHHSLLVVIPVAWVKHDPMVNNTAAINTGTVSLCIGISFSRWISVDV
jgi:hypothetical protein